MSMAMREESEQLTPSGHEFKRVIRQLKEIVHHMTADGLDEHASTLETTIADLEWRYSELGAELSLQGNPARPAVVSV